MAPNGPAYFEAAPPKAVMCSIALLLTEKKINYTHFIGDRWSKIYSYY